MASASAASTTGSSSSSGMYSSSAFEVYRKVVRNAVCATALEQGFTSCEPLALETLTEMLQATLIEICHSAKAYAELGGRTEASGADVCLAIVDSGIRMEGLREFIRRSHKITLPAPTSQPKISTPRTLQTGERKSFPSHIPEYLPAFPDSHAYVHTSTHRQPVTEYVAIREKLASQKRDIERALTRFVAKTSGTHTLFPDNPTLYPLIACKPHPLPCMVALMPKDQIFEDEDDEDKEEVLPEREGVPDNPYLRPVKRPRRRY